MKQMLTQPLSGECSGTEQLLGEAVQDLFFAATGLRQTPVELLADTTKLIDNFSCLCMVSLKSLNL